MHLRTARRITLTLAVAAAMAPAGCIPIPLAVPPLKVAVGVGGAIGNPLPDPATGIALADSVPMLTGRAGVTPTALAPQLNRRIVDVALGYTFQIFLDELRHNRNRHGFFGGLEVLLGHFWLGDNWRARITAHGFAEYHVLQARPGDGGGGSFGVGFEVAQYTTFERDGNERIFLGWFAGEWALGAELYGGVYSVAGADYGMVGLQVTARVPGLLGIGIIPLTGSF